MEKKPTKTLLGTTRVAGTVEGEALVTTEKLSHLFNGVTSEGVIRMEGHPLKGQSYADKIIVYDTDSLKMATLGAGIGFQKNWLGTRRDVLNAAVTGRFERTRW